MKSIFSHFFKSSLLNRVMRLIIVVVCLSCSAAASATNYYLKCKAAVATNSTGKGKVYIFKDEQSSSKAPDQGKETDETGENWKSESQNRKVTLFAYPEEGYYHKGWTRNDPSGNSVLEGLGKEYKEPYVADVYTASEDSKNPSTITFYAVFNHYRYAYSDGRTAKIAEGVEYGKISLDNTTWSTELVSASQGTMQTLRQKGDAKGSENDYIVLNYYAQLADENCFFLGWYVKDANGQYVKASSDDSYLNTTYSHVFYPSSEDSSNPSTVPTLYARFGKKAVYRNQATAQVVLASADNVYQNLGNEYNLTNVGQVYVDYVTGATANYASPTYTCGDGALKAISSNAASGNYSYTYYASAKEDYVFVGWSTTLSGDDGKIVYLSESSEYTHPHFTNITTDADARTPETLYAVFKQNTYYHYKGAIADFTENGEKGLITVTGTYYDGDEAKSFYATTDDGAIDDSGSTYNTQLNKQEYSYTYTAAYPDDASRGLIAWKGWSRSPRGGNIVDVNMTHTENYTSWATIATDAAKTPALYAVFQSYWYKDPTASAVGAGRVALTYEADKPSDNDYANSINNTTNPLRQVAANMEKHNYSVWYYANPNFGAYFKGWSQVADGSQLITDDSKNPYKVDYSVTATDDTAPFVPARLYAVFESVIQVIQKDRMIYYVDEHGNKNVNDANVIVNFNKASTLKATLKDNHDIFRISDKQNVQRGTELTLDASEGISHFVVSYIGNNPEQDVADKKTATITLSSAYINEKGVSGTATIDVEITIEEMPFVSFLPTDGKGSYTIKHTDGRGIDYSMPKNAAENINISIAHENMATFELNLTEDVEGDGLTFAGWQMIVDNVASYFSYDKKCTHSFKESAFVRPVFLADDRAVFTIDGDPTVRQEYANKYYDLQQALNDAAGVYAETNTAQVVVFSNEGKQEGTLYQGDYVIPEGVILLIPGVGPGDNFTVNNADEEDTYIYRLRHADKLNTGADIEVALTIDDYYTTSTAPYAYRKLYVEDNTTFTVQSGAVLYVYAALQGYGQLYEAHPYRYGQMILGENCQISVENGAAMYAFGFITGAESSRVTAHSGSEVHEVFQYADPRGGSGVAHLFINRAYYKVFPFCQYYIQNVEVPLELKGGSTEYITTTANLMEVEYMLMSAFIIPTTDDTNTTGLFQLSDDASLIKSYNPLTDRLNIKVIGTSASPANTKLGFIKVEMGDLGTEMLGETLNTIAQLGAWLLGEDVKNMIDDIQDVKLDSREYVLPLNNNMDLALVNTTLSVSSDFAFLAGSTFVIDENSTINLNSGANLYLYDAIDNMLYDNWLTGTNYGYNTGYFCNTNEPLIPLFATPNDSHLTTDKKSKKRLAANVTDAKWVVNGTVNVNSGAGLYTTSRVNGQHAQIVSTNKGKIYFSTKLDNKYTYQAKYMAKTGVSALINTSNFSVQKDNDESVHRRVPYVVTSAKLQNANGAYVTTEEANTFYYNPDRGEWLKTAPAQNALQGAETIVTMPDYDLNSEEVDPLSITLTSQLSNVKAAIYTWNGSEINNTATLNSDASGLHIIVDYTPTNKAGVYEGVINIDNSTYNQRITVIEDYTPRFSTIEEYNAQQVYLGTNIAYEQSLEIVPEADNVAGILSGTYASDWTYAITGANADEFTLVWGEGENKLSDAEIVFKPKTAGSKEALLALTCSYTDAANVTHTTCVQVPLTAVVYNLEANTLAFADGVESIFISSEAQSLFKNANSNATITITPEENDFVTITSDESGYKIEPKTKGSVTITATQDPDLENGIAGTTITKTITVTEDIVWNWKHLYFGSTNTNPVTVHESISIESIEISSESHKYTEADGTITETTDGDRHDVVNRLWQPEESTSGYNDHVSIAGWSEGETQVYFTVSYYVGNSNEPQVEDFPSEVYRDPSILPLNVNDNRIYEAVTWAQTGAKYSSTDATVTFTPTNGEVAQWTLTFIGIPDLLTFNAQGKSNWQIEESPNGTNWTIAYTWAKIASGVPFELELQPSTRYVRITYGIGDVKGVLSNIAISELTDVRADVEKLYMPAVTEGSTSKNVVFTYVSEDGYELNTSDDVFSANPNNLTGLAEAPYYQIKQVNVTSTATAETLGALNVDGTDLSIPIQVFTSPQAIPIQLASDHEERYYYVTTNTYNTTWDVDNRAVVMHNAVADASPYAVFHFADSPVPGIISFNFPTDAQGTWLVEESADATSWTTLVANTAEDLTNGFVMQDFQYPTTSRYVRVTYKSDYAEIVELTNLAILPTANATVNPSELTVYDTKAEKLQVTANNLTQVTFTLTPGFSLVNASGAALNEAALTGLFVKEGGGTISDEIYVKYEGTALATYGTLVISTTKDAEGNDLPEGEKTLATVQLTGLKKALPVGGTGLNTGTALTIKDFDGTTLREVKTQHAFAGSAPLFDYVIIYGETKTIDGATTISAPTSTSGSNALTPCYIYKKSADGTTYQLEKVVENANSSTKSWNDGDDAIETINGSLKVYITGFCPYASTGYSKADNGVWYFKGTSGNKIDIYLEDCYLYSRYKTKRGNSFSRSNGETYSDKVVRGSGAVLLFANQSSDASSMYVTIHTRGKNLLKSHYGCLFESIVGRAFQTSAPVQVYMLSKDHYINSHTDLTFTDEWPTAVDGSETERTNGFLSLRKQVNNAPSIDMGNMHTVVNFRGGQIELQNALNSSDNYESTLAISYRTGVYGPAKFRFELSHGIGTDGTDGTVNFYDGTTTVIPMTVPERYRQYYLMDKDENGKELSTTSCLRSQKNTFVHGGSHCMMRACPQPTDKGGAPKSGPDGVELGLYKYPAAPIYKKDAEGNPTTTIEHKGGWTIKTGWDNVEGAKLVTPTFVPEIPANYGVESITPNTNKTIDDASDDYLNLWVTSAYDQSVVPEVNATISFWKACMTQIEAKYGIYEGSIGGPTTIEFDGDKQVEEVYNLLYCEIDEMISNVISEGQGDPSQEKYKAPVLNPAPTDDPNEKYMEISPSNVGNETENFITNATDYKVQSKVYYIVPAKADIWMAFTAPFDVHKVYIMETRHEQDLHNDVINSDILDEEGYRTAMLRMQAKHNADFAAFFGVALALDSKKPFEDIFNDYIGWANYKDQQQGLGTGRRNKYNLVHYNKDFASTNGWNKADYYLYHNAGDWEMTTNADGNRQFTTKWEMVEPISETNKVLMRQGETYSMLFPYCTGCANEDGERDFWDYWTGKFLIFESVDGADIKDGYHLIKGSSFVGTTPTYTEIDNKKVFEAFEYSDAGLIASISGRGTGTNAVLTGNPTFAEMKTANSNVLLYSEDFVEQGFKVPISGETEILPTRSFLYTNVKAVTPEGQSLICVRRDGTIEYGNNGDNTTTDSHIPTVGGGNDLFITAINGGINIAVAEPQNVRVLTATGAIIFNGYITTAADVNLPTQGIYVISGENEVQKIFY